MSLRLSKTSSRNSLSFYIIEDVRDPNTKKRTTRTYKKLGSADSLKKQNGFTSDAQLNEYLQQLLEQARKEYQEQTADIILSFSQNKRIPSGKKNLINVGYLAPQKILSTLRLREICDEISQRHKFKFDLAAILNDLILTRIIYPGSKRSSFDDAHKFFDEPSYSLDQVYRALPVLSEERYFIESRLYENSSSIVRRDHSVLYYDCTNFYFEIEDEDENQFRSYGMSKEHRPNPIVQYGLFMDAAGIPLADLCFNGKSNEQKTMRDLEAAIESDFGLSRFIVCADAGLNSFDNRVFNDRDREKAYIVTQPIKKLKKYLKDWALDPEGWSLPGCSRIFNISELEKTTVVNGQSVPTENLTFYKDRWIKESKKSSLTDRKETLEEHLIVSYSTKYRDYCRHIREAKLARAEKLMKNPGNIKVKDNRNPRYFLKEISCTKDGEIADKKEYSIDYEKVEEDARYDGFYGVCTDLEDNDISLIIAANRNRWEIEESFQIMKSELKTRPIYVSREESIKGHLLTCFIALLVFRILEQYMDYSCTASELISTLRKMDLDCLQKGYYRPVFTRTDSTDRLREIFGYELDTEILSEKNLKKFIRNSKAKKITQKNLYKKSR